MTHPPSPAEPTAALLPLLREFLRPYRARIGLVLVLQLAQALGLLYLPTLNAGIVDNGILAGDTGYILRHGGVMLGVTVLQLCCAAAAVYLGARIAMDLGHDLRGALFARVQGFSAEEVGRFGAPSLLTRTTNDVQQVQVLAFIGLTLALTAPFMAFGGVALALSQDVPSSVVLLVAIPLLVGAIGLVIRRMIPPSRAMQGRIDTVNQILREQITGIRVVRAFVRDTYEQARFAEANTELTGVAVRVGRLQAYFGATASLVSNLAAVAVVAFAGPRIAAGGMPLGSLIAFLNYLGQILIAVMMAMSVFMLAPRARVSAGRIREVLDTEPGIADPAVPAALPDPRGDLDVSGVSFRYPGAEEPVLHEVDLVARQGQTTAIVGSTGSGKTTLVHLVARLLDAESGSVCIDGADVRRLDRATLASTVAIVPQRAYLFSGTIADNLRYGDPDASDERLWRALDVAQAAGFVAALPHGLDTVLGQGGSTVSGGQRQRLAIARALVARPRIYLFDDAFSALDNTTEADLRAALTAEIGDAIQVVVAQRVSSVRSADRIVVLGSGRVEATGTHEELLTASPTYAEIVHSQLTPQEAR